MKKLDNQGFGAIEIIMAVVIIGLLGLCGWLFYSRQHKTPTTTSTTSTQAAPAKATTATPAAPATDPNAGYLVIKEWGVKIKMKDAEKVTYTYSATGKGEEQSNGTYDSSVGLAVKPEFLQNKTCKVSVGYDRYTKVIDFFKESAPKIGNYYYISGGSPYNCENDADNALNKSIRTDFVNIVAQ